MFTRARVPASSANLGPGFDSLGLALARYLTVNATDAAEFRLTSRDQDGHILQDRAGMAAKIARAARGNDKVHLDVRSEIPLARGLGSSGALALGIALALGHPDPVALAVEFEGHPENVAASFWGGAVVSGVVSGHLETRSLRVDPELCCVVVVPEVEIATKEAREALPCQVSLEDASFNLTRALLLAESLGDVNMLAPELFEDRWHQGARTRLFPDAPRVLEILVESGARGAAWSGSGSAFLGLTAVPVAPWVASRVAERLAELDVVAEVEVVMVDRIGAVVE